MGLPLYVDPDKHIATLYEDVNYKDYWSGRQKRITNEAEHAVIRDMLPPFGSRLIDIGCGYGRLSDCYQGRFKQVIMFDGSMSLLHQARENTLGTAFYIAGDLLHNPFKPASFDTILMIRVFHHIADSKTCLSELYRLLPGNGQLIFTYKNIANPMHIFKWLTRMEPGSPFSLEPSSINIGLLAHHPIYIHRALLKTGFTNLHYQGLGIFDKLATKKRFLGKWASTGKKLAPFFGRIKVAPWMFCSGISNQNISLTECSQLDDLLICPNCKGDLLHEMNHYTCISCHQKYPVIDDILDFRIE